MSKNTHTCAYSLWPAACLRLVVASSYGPIRSSSLHLHIERKCPYVKAHRRRHRSPLRCLHHILDLAAWYGCNHLADSRIHGFLISRRGHKFAVHASQGFVVSHCRITQHLAVNVCTHDNCFVEGLHGCVWRDTGEGLRVDVGVPRGTLDEGVGGIRELGSSCLNRAKLGRESCRCVLELGRDGVCLHDVLEFQERLVCFLCVGFLHC